MGANIPIFQSAENARDEAPNIESAIRYLYTHHQYTNFRFISQNGRETFKVHKLILAIYSPVLAKMVYGSSPCYSIQIETADNLAIQNMIRYIYNQTENIVLEDLYDIKQTKTIADKYEITELGEICKRKLADIEVNISNVLTILETAEEFRNEAKENESITLIGKNQDAVFTSQQFIRMQFQKVLNIFDKLRDMNMMSESVFLRSAIRWLKTNKNISKKKILMRKVNVANILLNDYLDIIQSYGEFFTNTEISAAVRQIRSRQNTQTEPEAERFRDIGTNTETKRYVESMVQVEPDFLDKLSDSERYRHIGTNTEIKGNEVLKKKVPGRRYHNPERPKRLTIHIPKEEDRINAFHFTATITIEDSNGKRNLQVRINDILKKGLLGTVVGKKTDHTIQDEGDISYEGVYYMVRSLKELDPTLTPTQYIEVLKASLHFQLQDLSDKCTTKISNIVDYDPMFLDGLRRLPYFEEKCLRLLLSEPMNVILHPNFINCSAELIIVLLQFNELRVKSELQLLLAIIVWLEAGKGYQRRRFRFQLLNRLAFQNITATEFTYAVKFNPNFFTDEEKKLILSYRYAVGGEVKYLRDKLPEWYNFKCRKII